MPIDPLPNPNLTALLDQFRELRERGINRVGNSGSKGNPLNRALHTKPWPCGHEQPSLFEPVLDIGIVKFDFYASTEGPNQATEPPWLLVQPRPEVLEMAARSYPGRTAPS